ncbi:Solute carrier family 35 member F5 [Balamuthia mandrillaris]
MAEEREREQSAGKPILAVGPSDAPRLRLRWILGVGLMVGVVFIWVSSSELMQFIFKDNHFGHPFFLTYFSTSLFSIYLLDYIRDLKCFRKKAGSEGGEAKDKMQAGHRYTNLQDEEEALSINTTASTITVAPFSSRELAKIALVFCLVWFIANYSYNASLTLTSVSSNTVLSSTSSLGTLILSVMFRVDTFSLPKLLAVLLTLGGVAMVSFSDAKDDQKDRLWGDLLSLLSAMFYALYATLLKKMIPDESRLNACRFFGIYTYPLLLPSSLHHNKHILEMKTKPHKTKTGMVGTFNFVMLWPVIIVLHYTGVEEFSVPEWKVWLYLLANGLIGTVLSDFLWLWAILLTSPLVGTVGLSLSIPIAMAADIVLKKDTRFTFMFLGGSLLVVAGFLLVNLAPVVSSRLNGVLARWRRPRPSPSIAGPEGEDVVGLIL